MTTSVSRFSFPALLAGALMMMGLAGAGCGSDDESSCSSVASKLCQAACNCGGSAGCSIGDESGGITFDNKADCVSLYSLGCSQPSEGIDYKACADALDSPTCVASSSGMVLKTPAACDDAE